MSGIGVSLMFQFIFIYVQLFIFIHSQCPCIAQMAAGEHVMDMDLISTYFVLLALADDTFGPTFYPLCTFW